MKKSQLRFHFPLVSILILLGAFSSTLALAVRFEAGADDSRHMHECLGPGTHCLSASPVTASALKLSATTPTLTSGPIASTWRALPSLGGALGEVCNAILTVNSRSTLFSMGQGSKTVYRFDLVANRFLSPASNRIASGNHAACEVWNNKLYVLGGFSSMKNVQVHLYGSRLPLKFVRFLRSIFNLCSSKYS